jgi:UDP-N-acetylmuramate dehydrogenase
VARDGKIVIYDKEALKFGYRRSAMMEDGSVITRVTMLLAKGNLKDIAALMSECDAQRKAKQPIALPSAGSFFKRPEGHFAGALIEQAGLKGREVGGARVSDLHAGFIVNTGNASASDVIKLKDLIIEKVYEKFNVTLEPEVRIIGSDNRTE